jgi:hypothetical protein
LEPWTFSRISSGIGSGHMFSPTLAAVACRASSSSGRFDMIPEVRVPSAITQAPVSVATSTSRSGLSSLAVVIASASTSRPSASVLSTSTVLPPYILSTSPGRVAVPDGMFSARLA